MPKGEWATPQEEQYAAAIEEAANPTKQLELIEKRSTWVYTAVGTVGTVLAGFTLFAGSRSLFDVNPLVGAVVVILTLAALALAASTLMLRKATLNVNDIDDAEDYFQRLVPGRAVRATWAVGLLAAAIVIAGVSALFAVAGRDTSKLVLEAQRSADGPTVSLAVTVGDLDPGATIKGTLTATTTADESEQLYEASASADSTGSVTLEADVPVPEDATTASLVVTEALADRRIDSASIEIPAAPSGKAQGQTIDSVVDDSASSLASFWQDELAASGVRAESVPRVVSFDSALGQLPPVCSDADDIDELINNAFYCTETNEIAWDRNLMRQVYPEFGTYSVAALIAHEWAHWVQRQTGGVSDANAEKHADCLAGAWSMVEESNGESGLGLAATDRANALVALTLYTSAASEQSPKLQRNPRIVAFQAGVREGLSGCEKYAA